MRQRADAVDVKPLTLDLWADFEELFGDRGACGGCWCMWFRISRKQFEAQKGEGNRRAIKAIVASGRVPGLLAYHEGRAVGWCSVAPREEFPRLDNSRILGRIDDRPVWSVVCLFVAKEHRNKGLSTRLLEAAVDYVRDRGGRIVEGYAVEPKKDVMPATFAYHGLASAYRGAGFVEVARRSQTRPIMRYEIEGS
jgi:GNAT superfamily N-acetyltransferase